MAGWKLRKDKIPAETTGADPMAAAPADVQFHEEHPREELGKKDPELTDSAPALPDFDSDTDLHFTETEFDGDDGPLTLVDYSEPGTENHAAESHSLDTHTAENHAAENYSPEAFAVDTPVQEIPTPVASDDFLDRLRTDRNLPAEPAAGVPDFGPALGSGIPAVAPFVLDTPPPAAPPEPVPQLIVHFGRLSAAFPLTKETTTIGRPDSALQHYPDVEIDMDDAVSRRHAEIVKRAGGFYLVDTGSTNGTMLNGEVLPPHQERLLAHGDRIRVGDRTEIIFE